MNREFRVGILFFFAGVSFAVAGIVSSFSELSFLAAFAGSAAFLTPIAVLTFKWLARKIEARDQDLHRLGHLEGTVLSMTLAQARQEAEIVLREIKPQMGFATESELQNVISDGDIRELLTRYGEVRIGNSEAILGLAYVGPSRYERGATRIGWDSDQREIVVRRGSPSLYELSAPEDVEATYPSVFHWICLQNALLKA